MFQEAALAFLGHFMAGLEAATSREKAFLIQIQTLSIYFWNSKVEGHCRQKEQKHDGLEE